jgi:hypothetical protein
MPVARARGCAGARRRRLALALLVSALGSACAAPLEDPARFTGGGGGSCPEGTDVEADVLAVRCAGSICHSPGENPGGGLDLVSEGAIDRVNGVASPNCSGEVLAVPGDPDASLIVQKLGDDPPCGERMPLIGELDPGEEACIRDWIQAMAPGGE